jgi:membrane protein involved in colicin uptake
MLLLYAYCKAMSHERMLRAEKELEREINALIRKAEILDAQEDRRYGKGTLGSELPDELRHKQGCLEKIRLARKEMEAEAAAAAARQEEAEKARAKATAAEESKASATEQAELSREAEAAAAKAKAAKEKAIEAAETAGLEPTDLEPMKSDADAHAWSGSESRRHTNQDDPAKLPLRWPAATSIPTAISCSPAAPICRATTASWRSTATTR